MKNVSLNEISAESVQGDAKKNLLLIDLICTQQDKTRLPDFLSRRHSLSMYGHLVSSMWGQKWDEGFSFLCASIDQNTPQDCLVALFTSPFLNDQRHAFCLFEKLVALPQQKQPLLLWLKEVNSRFSDPMKDEKISHLIDFLQNYPSPQSLLSNLYSLGLLHYNFGAKGNREIHHQLTINPSSLVLARVDFIPPSKMLEIVQNMPSQELASTALSPIHQRMSTLMSLKQYKDAFDLLKVDFCLMEKDTGPTQRKAHIKDVLSYFCRSLKDSKEIVSDDFIHFAQDIAISNPNLAREVFNSSLLNQVWEGAKNKLFDFEGFMRWHDLTRWEYRVAFFNQLKENDFTLLNNWASQEMKKDIVMHTTNRNSTIEAWRTSLAISHALQPSLGQSIAPLKLRKKM